MAMLLFEGDGLPLDCSDYFSGLGKVSTSIGVMGIFNEMRCNFTALFEVHLRLPCARGGDCGDRKNSCTVPEIRERNE